MKTKEEIGALVKQIISDKLEELVQINSYYDRPTFRKDSFDTWKILKPLLKIKKVPLKHAIMLLDSVTPFAFSNEHIKFKVKTMFQVCASRYVEDSIYLTYHAIYESLRASFNNVKFSDKLKADKIVPAAHYMTDAFKSAFYTELGSDEIADDDLRDYAVMTVDGIIEDKDFSNPLLKACLSGGIWIVNRETYLEEIKKYIQTL